MILSGFLLKRVHSQVYDFLVARHGLDPSFMFKGFKGFLACFIILQIQIISIEK